MSCSPKDLYADQKDTFLHVFCCVLASSDMFPTISKNQRNTHFLRLFNSEFYLITCHYNVWEKR